MPRFCSNSPMFDHGLTAPCPRHFSLVGEKEDSRFGFGKTERPPSSCCCARCLCGLLTKPLSVIHSWPLMSRPSSIHSSGYDKQNGQHLAVGKLTVSRSRRRRGRLEPAYCFSIHSSAMQYKNRNRSVRLKSCHNSDTAG